MEINDNLLRPTSLNDFIGQEQLKYKLNIYISVAKKRKETLDHILFYGPPGLGKTTLANLISNEMNCGIKIVNAANLEKVYELINILLSLEPGDILFIDEIHRLPRQLEEILYSAMEDFYIQVIVNKNESSKSVHIDLPPFTIIGATTMFGNISSPLRSRFQICERMYYYNINEISNIIKRTLNVYNLKYDELAIRNIAKRCRGTPRICNSIVKRIRDFCEYNKMKLVDSKIVNNVCTLLNIDDNGLNYEDYKYLFTLYNLSNKSSIGLESLALSLNENVKTISDVIEPYLIHKEFIYRTKQGRCLTDKGIEYVKSKIIPFLSSLPR